MSFLYNSRYNQFFSKQYSCLYSSEILIHLSTLHESLFKSHQIQGLTTKILNTKQF